MPTYNFKNNETGEEFEEFFHIADREEYLKNNPHIQQLPSLFAMSYSGTGDLVKNDSGWKEHMSRIAEANPGSSVSDRYGKESTKSAKTRQVLKKHGVID